MVDYEIIENLSEKQIFELYDNIINFNTDNLISTACYISCVCTNGYAYNASDWYAPTVGTSSAYPYIYSGLSIYDINWSPLCQSRCTNIGSSMRCLYLQYCR